MDLSPDEDNFQGRLLHQAALWDNVELLQELLANGASVDAQDDHGRTALHAASLCERSRCDEALCAAGACVDAQSDAATGGKTALHTAAERGHVENVRVLVGAGASLELRDAGGDTPLALAENNGHRHAAAALREARDALERERLSTHAQLRELVSRGESGQLRTRLQAIGPAAGIIVNLTPNGANTLLYVACEAGQLPTVAALLCAGADGRAHPVTKYSPLYIAAYHGHVEIAKLLLAHFPHAVQQETVEKWLPLHAACIGGHGPLVKLLLEHQYPEALLTTYTDATGVWQYRFAMDVNARDASGQTPLYVACALGHAAAVEALLAHTVPCERAHTTQGEDPPPAPAPAAVSPPRAGISLGIHAIVSKLTGATKEPPACPPRRVRPARWDVHRACAGGADSCLAAAVRGGHHKVAALLLEGGAAPDAPAAPMPSDSRSRSRSAPPRAAPRPASPAHPLHSAEGWSALSLAARLGHTRLVEELLKRGANDPRGRALQECSAQGQHQLFAQLLATKAYPDPDYKLNKAALSASVFNSRGADTTLTFNALCPATPVMVNWSGLGCHLANIRMCWLRGAALRVNSRLAGAGAGVGGAGGAVHSLTRVDVSNNELRALPPELFTLASLRYLNAGQNKLERLPSPSDPFEEELDSKGRKIKRSKKRPEVYSAPVLQEIYLQDNRLEDIPPELFLLPSLTTVDVSNNKLRALPAAMWRAPALLQLNAALNHLRDLPVTSQNENDARRPSVTSPVDTAPEGASRQGSLNKSVSRSPSIETSECETDDTIPMMGDRAGNAVWSAAVRAHPWRGVAEGCAAPPPLTGSALTSLNLSHNQLTAVPPALACLAPRLARLNLAYNSLRSMSYVTSYPTSLRQLDLSHNEITCWPSLPQLDAVGSLEDPLACYCKGGAARGRSAGGGRRAQLLAAACPARRHLRLEALRTLILSNNLLTRIQLTTDDDGDAPPPPAETQDGDDWEAGAVGRSRLVFPLLSMLDVSMNLLRALPNNIHELTNLAVLNISGNKDITDLPPTMGLLSRLWSLSAAGCSLHEPLRSMLATPQPKYRSMDVVSYLKSVLQEAKPYARMKLMLCGLQGIGKTSLLECLVSESSVSRRRRPAEHWTKRMGGRARGGNISTVGVDIGTWTYEKQRSSRGPVTFRTWDFGGQQEYYATHQYFLSRRSLYLVLWKVTDGKKGLAGAVNWLRSIQARAPGSPVIMVATHYDQVANSELPEGESPESLQRIIRTSIMGAADADKLGLPRVLDSVEVSCSTRHNIRLLADIIYSVAFSVKPPGSKQPLLEQLVPASYLALEECVTSLSADLGLPVVCYQDYRRLVTQYMIQKNYRPFRDTAELHQATMFLHENGVLLHYDDATLKELYFLRPQWLCDVLAHVVTVREVNPFAANGIMKVEDLAHVFKASPQLLRGEEAGSLGVSLLNKFELALCWDGRVLLVPPLLPPQEPSQPQLPLVSRLYAPRPARWPLPSPAPAVAPPPAARGTDSPTLVQDESPRLVVTGRGGARAALRRLLLLSYVPCGFWPRLVTRVLADTSVRSAALAVYQPSSEMVVDESVCLSLEAGLGWKLWRTGLKLCCGALPLLAVRELPARRDALMGPLADDDGGEPDLRLRVKQEGVWCSLDVQSSACVEVVLPSEVCVVKSGDQSPLGLYQSVSLEPNEEALAKLLALIADHVDLLLEDWYPSLGTRFVHTSEGRCLITRVVPCPACLKDLDHEDDHAQAFRRLDLGEAGEGAERGGGLRLSEESRASDADSGVDAESNASSRVGSVEGGAEVRARIVFGWSVEECILGACTAGQTPCPRHGPQPRLAPDTLLLDVPQSMRVRWEQVTLRAVCGRGAFGTVLSGEWRRGGDVTSVAVKALQPVLPPHPCDTAALHAYKAALSRWERDPCSSACRAYCGLRQELGVLTRLSHAHVTPLLGACGAPLALLLPLAPQGALDGVLSAYRGRGARAGARAAGAVLLQVARALEYLHARRIVYRDLKSENVLVWSFPPPQDAAAAESCAGAVPVHVKLADYGISRLAPPSGTKGFGGTEGFMAPEIMRYNGEEEYNEKVDCFSYGMLVYEVITLRPPFEGHEAVKEAILEGARPTLDTKDLQWGCSVLECMRRCWADAPAARPSAAALVCVCAAPEFAALQDAAHAAHVASAAAATPIAANGVRGWEVWYAGEAGRVHTLGASPHHFTSQHTLRVPAEANGVPASVTAMCLVGQSMWLADSAARIFAYSVSSLSLQWVSELRGAVGGACAGGVASLLHLPALQRVAVAMHCGRLFLVDEAGAAAAGEGFLLTELGAATDLRCLACVTTQAGVEVWAGGSALYAYTLRGGCVSAADTLQGDAGAGTVTLIAAGAEPYVAAYTQPGVCVTLWSARSRLQSARLDCSKLAPCSESLQSIAIDEHLNEDRCTVTALACFGGCVYVGTAWGCLIVCDGSLRPLTVLRPVEEQLTAIVPLVGSGGGQAMLATLGGGYRPLLNRFAPPQANNRDSLHVGPHCLLWKTNRWLPD